MKRYNIMVASTPGATPQLIVYGVPLVTARKKAKHIASKRLDLTYQDIRIDNQDGTLREYAGPAR